jgi:putative transport protein
MSWLSELLSGNSVANAMITISAAIVLGMALGSIKIGSIRFGVAGVLFGAIALGHFGFEVNHEILEFCRELGLMLFVFLTGMQVGPGFFAAFKKQGLVLNVLAGSVVILGVLTTIFIGKFWLAEQPFAISVGLLSGATTNTPSLGAAQQTLIEQNLSEDASLTSIGYAIAYPFGVIGIILVLLFLRIVLKVDLAKEKQLFDKIWGIGKSDLGQRHLLVENSSIVDQPLGKVISSSNPGVVVSRILKNGTLSVATKDTILALGDVILAVGSQKGLDNFQMLIGGKVEQDLTEEPGDLDSRTAIATSQAVLGKSLADLNLGARFNVSVTRIRRSGIELVAYPETQLQFADTLRLVGQPEMMQAAALELGDSRSAVDSPRLVPVFLGLAIGILLGSIPFHLPGMPVPVKLGLAGGPLIASIVLSRIGRIGPVIWHMHDSANRTLREFGIVLFLACIGLKAGGGFIETLLNGSGLYYLMYGALITIIPITVIGLVASLILKQNYISLTGLIAGSMTDPPALAFADSMTGSKGPALAYATVYPVVMILRIISTQILVLLFC